MPEEELRLAPHWLQVHASAFVARGAVVMGDVTLEADASVWFGCVLRGDTDHLHVGEGANVQDGSIVHADPGFPARIGARATIGHRCIVHGAEVGEGTLVGMGSILLNGAVIGPHCLVGAGALVTAGKRFEEPGMLILGSPAKVVRPLTEAERADLQDSARRYVQKARAMKAAGWQDPSQR